MKFKDFLIENNIPYTVDIFGIVLVLDEDLYPFEKELKKSCPEFLFTSEVIRIYVEPKHIYLDC